MIKRKAIKCYSLKKRHLGISIKEKRLARIFLLRSKIFLLVHRCLNEINIVQDEKQYKLKESMLIAGIFYLYKHIKLTFVTKNDLKVTFININIIFYFNKCT